jgi:hypothetical protein
MLSSHHWPGMAFAFLLMLLTKSGKDICLSCFQENDIKDADYDWDSSPGLDLDNVYKPPSLYQTQPTMPIQLDNEFPDNNSGDQDKVGYGIGRGNGKESESDDNDSEPGNLMKKKKKASKGPIKVKCSLKQFVGLLESLLVFHAMYK